MLRKNKVKSGLLFAKKINKETPKTLFNQLSKLKATLKINIVNPSMFK